jgi:hypothetical protein
MQCPNATPTNTCAKYFIVLDPEKFFLFQLQKSFFLLFVILKIFQLQDEVSFLGVDPIKVVTSLKPGQFLIFYSVLN